MAKMNGQKENTRLQNTTQNSKDRAIQNP